MDLSEMFFVHHTYSEKANNYLRYQGTSNFSEGGQAHDVMNVIREFGMVPENIYPGYIYNIPEHKHEEMVAVLKSILDKSLEFKENYSGKANKIIDEALNIYMGNYPDHFTFNKKELTPKEFTKQLGFNPEDYVEFTSYMIYPWYQAVDLQIPDNWAHRYYYNLPIEDIMSIINFAFEKGFSVNWDGDVGDNGFSHTEGLALVPEDDPAKMTEENRGKFLKLNEEARNAFIYRYDKPIQEKIITEELRQKEFDKFIATDDHLMHLVGVAKDQNGVVYYLTKNSWGSTSNELGGNLLMSENYVKLKTIAIMVHKNAIPPAILKKLSENKQKSQL
jgi:bleomycin hydrolase